jgi:hypothetical protein
MLHFAARAVGGILAHEGEERSAHTARSEKHHEDAKNYAHADHLDLEVRCGTWF